MLKFKLINTLILIVGIAGISAFYIDYKYLKMNIKNGDIAMSKLANTQIDLKNKVINLETENRSNQYKIKRAYEHTLYSQFFDELNNEQTYTYGKYKLQYAFQDSNLFCYDFYICNGNNCQMHPDSTSMNCIEATKTITDFNVKEEYTTLSPHALLVISYKTDNQLKQELLLPYDCNESICYEMFSEYVGDELVLDTFEIQTNPSTKDIEIAARLYGVKDKQVTFYTYTLTVYEGKIVVSVG